MPIRLTYLIGLLTVSGLLFISLYLQFFAGFIPCPLCTLQRASFIFLGILFLLGVFLHKKPWGRGLISIFATLVSLSGIFFSGRQVWLQHFPSENANECGVSLKYMLEVLPMNEVLQKIFAGTAECAEPGSVFLNLNMAEWSFIWFIFFLLLSLYLLIKELRFLKSR